MNDASWVMLAGIAAWLGMGAWLLLLSRRASALELRLKTLEFSAGKKDQDA